MSIQQTRQESTGAPVRYQGSHFRVPTPSLGPGWIHRSTRAGDYIIWRNHWYITIGKMAPFSFTQPLRHQYLVFLWFAWLHPKHKYFFILCFCNILGPALASSWGWGNHMDIADHGPSPGTCPWLCWEYHPQSIPEPQPLSGVGRGGAWARAPPPLSKKK